MKKSIENLFRGWLPKESNIAYAKKAAKLRWRKPFWIAFTLIGIIAIAGVAFLGVRAYIRYSDPQADVTAAYYEKSLNCSPANIGDVIEVKVLVGWHGYIFPEFKRQVVIIDPFPESNFQLLSGNNTHQYSGYGGGDQFTYLLKVVGNYTQSIELPKPRLYLDGSEISLRGTSAVLEVQTVPESES
jgi:hypothetical protein